MTVFKPVLSADCNKTANINVKKLNSLKQCLRATRPNVNHTTKTAKIKKVLLRRSMLTLWRRAAKVIAPF